MQKSKVTEFYVHFNIAIYPHMGPLWHIFQKIIALWFFSTEVCLRYEKISPDTKELIYDKFVCFPPKIGHPGHILGLGGGKTDKVQYLHGFWTDYCDYYMKKYLICDADLNLISLFVFR